ncbi:MAG: excinuclease ABC subunit UvrA [Bryobacteraceae bacterium]|nr:excinuclease ABC subunit UvrA [Bryobacteraceae bacterium]MDW8378682.1 excinuclease ABC subunit UvrA [Bryobacterales bacterium]
MLEKITVHGARQHNLKNIDVEIPRNSLTVITGLSGSGKSSLAFDTIYAEGQRRYVETLSPYARQFLDQMERPDVDSIDGLSPAISIEQKTTNRSPRSTVGTVTEIYDYLRVLYSSIGVAMCPNCNIEITRQSTQQIVDQILALGQGERIMILAPVVRGRKGEYKKDLERYSKQGFVRARIDGVLLSLDEEITLDKRKNHSIEIVVDRLLIRGGIEKRLEASVETATRLANGLVLVSVVGGPEKLFSQKMACPDCGESVPQLEPRSFSFNSPYGACPRCHGLGSQYTFDPEKVVADPSRPLLDGGLSAGANSVIMQRYLEEAARRFKIPLRTPFEEFPAKTQKLLLEGGPGFPGIVRILQQIYEESTSEDYRQWLFEQMTPTTCPECKGARLRPSSLAVRVKGVSIAEFTRSSVARLLPLLESWRLSEREQQIAGRVLEEIRARLEFLSAVGLDYLSLDRSSATLSGGEAQRIRLATQIGSKLRGVLYVLDEPSIGLHPRDNERLLNTLTQLRDLGNTVLVVEHDQETIERADYVIDLGPGAGRLGGEVVAQGPPQLIRENEASLTGQYLSGKRRIETRQSRRPGNGFFLTIRGAREHNLKNITASIPLGALTVVTGVSGSGKSTLVNDILYRKLANLLYGSKHEVGAHDEIVGVERIDKVIEIDQSPIGRTPRSNPATYTGVFSAIRDLFAMLPESRQRGYKPGRFSFNVKGGRCEACQGDGLKRIEMNFLPDVFVSCDVCRGKRYNLETLQVKYRGKSIADVLESTVEEALALLENIPQIKVKLQTLVDVGLDYIHLGQSSTTLSGGEAQRIKLARELSKRQTGRTLYILDEPTTGLHFDDVRKLLDVLQRLVDLGNTVVVIEHHLDVIRAADWIIDLGPEGGERGGQLMVEGPPELVMKTKKSHTGQALLRAQGGEGTRNIA